MKLHFLCSEGSPLGLVPDDIYNRGVGGAELALMTLAELLGTRGHDVTIYNNPRQPGVYAGGVKYEPLQNWNHADERDAIVLFRTPQRTFHAARGRRVFWSCDQYTTGDFQRDIFPYAERIVCISPRHAEFFEKHYGLSHTDERLHILNLGVRTQDYPKDIAKVPGRMIYCSVPNRGLMNLHAMWPRIKQAVPNAGLVITADYRLWGAEPLDHEYRLHFMGAEGVRYCGNLPRRDLVVEQLQAEYMLYPNEYDELFCISCAECAYAGALPVTSRIGALETTNRFGVRIDGNPREEPFRNDFVRRVTGLANDPENAQIIRDTCKLHAMTDFNWDALVLLWEQTVLA